jgi:hypothetical protein
VVLGIRFCHKQRRIDRNTPRNLRVKLCRDPEGFLNEGNLPYYVTFTQPSNLPFWIMFIAS